MKRDTLKTIAGLIVIAGIVVATFLYGNSQRQAQLTRDQNIKKEQEQKAQATGTAQASPSPAATGQAAANTAPVQSPASNNLQGSGKATPTPVAASPTPTPIPVVAGAATTGTPAAGVTMPETGPEMIGLLGLGTMTGMVVAVRRSRRAIVEAARKPRM